jgi:hypothetical protein
MRPLFVLALLIGPALIPSTPLARQNTHGALPPRELLGTVAQFTSADWAAVERGEAVAKVLETDSREIAVTGAVRIAGSRESLIARYRDIESLKRSALVLDVGRFGATPTAADLSGAPFEEYSLDMQNCRAGDCHVRLAAGDIARFQREVSWRGPGWRNQSAAIWREVLAGYAAGYLRGGRRALPDYANRREPLSVGDELALLLPQFDFLDQYAPEFRAYMQEFGPQVPPGAEQTLYWTKEDFGVRPILRIVHQVVYRNAAGARAAVIASNQVYADHYLDAALGVTLVLDASDGHGEAFYMIAANRARTRSLGGFLRRVVRSTVQGRSRDTLRNILTATKRAIEAHPVATVPGTAFPQNRSRAGRQPRSILGHHNSNLDEEVRDGSADWRGRSGFRSGDDRGSGSLS